MRAQQGGLGVVATDRNVVWTCSIDGTAMDRCRSDGAVSAAERTNRHGVLEEWRIEISKDMGHAGMENTRHTQRMRKRYINAMRDRVVTTPCLVGLKP